MGILFMLGVWLLASLPLGFTVGAFLHERTGGDRRARE